MSCPDEGRGRPTGAAAPGGRVDASGLGYRSSPAVRMTTAGAVLLLIVSTALVAARWTPLMVFDQAAVDAADLAAATHPLLLSIVRVVTDAGSPVSVDVLTAVGVVVLLVRRRWWPAAYLPAVRLVELGAEQTLKDVLDRPRPVPPVVLATAQGASFPSGHTAGTAALCLSLVVIVLPRLRRRGRRAVVPVAAIAIAAAVAVAASRVFLGVHFPSDVAGGLLVGGLSAVITLVAVAVAARTWRARRASPH